MLHYAYLIKTRYHGFYEIRISVNENKAHSSKFKSISNLNNLK